MENGIFMSVFCLKTKGRKKNGRKRKRRGEKERVST